MKRLNRATATLLALAALVAAAQFVSAFFVHVGARAHPTPSGWAMPPTRTYMQTYGASEVILTALSLLAVVLVVSVLSRRGNRGAGGAGWLAWGVSVVAAVLGLVGFVYLFGVGLCLLLACATVPRPCTTPSSAGPAVVPLQTTVP